MNKSITDPVVKSWSPCYCTNGVNHGDNPWHCTLRRSHHQSLASAAAMALWHQPKKKIYQNVSIQASVVCTGYQRSEVLRTYTLLPPQPTKELVLSILIFQHVMLNASKAPTNRGGWIRLNSDAHEYEAKSHRTQADSGGTRHA